MLICWHKWQGYRSARLSSFTKPSISFEIDGLFIRISKMKRNKSTAKSPTKIPFGDWEALLRRKHEVSGEIRIPTSRHDRFSSPSLIFSDTQKVWFRALDRQDQSMYVVKGPTNIQHKYKGLPGSSLSLVPSGGYTTVTHSVNGQQEPINFIYIILNEDGDVIDTPAALTFNPTLGKRDQYRIFAVDANNNFSLVQRFILESAESKDIGTGGIQIGNLINGLPDHMNANSSGVINISWNNISSHSEVVYARITSTLNMTITPSKYIRSGDDVNFKVNGREAIVGTDIGYDVEFYTQAGETSLMDFEARSIILPNVPPSTVGLVHNFPDEVHDGEVIAWSWAGGTDVDGDNLTLDFVNISNGASNTMLNIAPGAVVPITVPGQHFALVILRYQLRDTYAVSPIQQHVAVIKMKPPVLTDVAVTINNVNIETHEPIYPCSTFDILYTGASDFGGNDITVTLSTEAQGVTFSSTAVSQGTPINVGIPCNHDPANPIILRAIFSNGGTESVREDTLQISPITGQETITVSRVFVKPAGVTSLTILGQGGLGEDTVIGGAVSYTFQGGLVTDPEKPAPYTQAFYNLPGDTQTISVSLATDTEVTLYW
jgi:hypothetical protein